MGTVASVDQLDTTSASAIVNGCFGVAPMTLEGQFRTLENAGAALGSGCVVRGPTSIGGGSESVSDLETWSERIPAYGSLCGAKSLHADVFDKRVRGQRQDDTP
jgi:hypothetical protein